MRKRKKKKKVLVKLLLCDLKREKKNINSIIRRLLRLYIYIYIVISIFVEVAFDIQRRNRWGSGVFIAHSYLYVIIKMKINR